MTFREFMDRYASFLFVALPNAAAWLTQISKQGFFQALHFQGVFIGCFYKPFIYFAAFFDKFTNNENEPYLLFSKEEISKENLIHDGIAFTSGVLVNAVLNREFTLDSISNGFFYLGADALFRESVRAFCNEHQSDETAFDSPPKKSRMRKRATGSL